MRCGISISFLLRCVDGPRFVYPLSWTLGPLLLSQLRIPLVTHICVDVFVRTYSFLSLGRNLRVGLLCCTINSYLTSQETAKWFSEFHGGVHPPEASVPGGRRLFGSAAGLRAQASLAAHRRWEDGGVSPGSTVSGGLYSHSRWPVRS